MFWSKWPRKSKKYLKPLVKTATQKSQKGHPKKSKGQQTQSGDILHMKVYILYVLFLYSFHKTKIFTVGTHQHYKAPLLAQLAKHCPYPMSPVLAGVTIKSLLILQNSFGKMYTFSRLIEW